jgi:pyruvate formate lyase activating enzyme
VVVSTADGREGCLLPGIPAIRTVQQQIDLARLKGGIQAGEPVRMQRFETTKLREAEVTRPGGFMFRPKIEPNHQAGWWTILPDGRIECQLCPRLCKLQEGQRGFCFVRQRLDNHLVLTAYGRSSGFCVDPMEKKPLNHFYPGTSVLSFGTAGCNLGCRFCQNWDISKAREFNRLADTASPETIAKAARKLGCKAVAFTYNDPVIFAEYAIDVALACHALGVQTVAVTAGYMNPRPRAEFYQHIDAANVDLKGFTEEFYHKLCFGRLAPVLETLEYLRQGTKVWLEVTSLLIPGENDDEKQLHWAADWFAEHLGPDVPWHFTAFHPDFKMLDKPPTPLATLEKARAIALSKGLRYVYTGNVDDPVGNSTRCPQCQRVLIKREGYEIGTWNLKAGCCRFCGFAIPGRFENQRGTWGGRRTTVRLN